MKIRTSNYFDTWKNAIDYLDILPQYHDETSRDLLRDIWNEIGATVYFDDHIGNLLIMINRVCSRW